MNTKRIGLWGGAILLLGLMVWGLANLAVGPTANVGGPDLSEAVTGSDHVAGGTMAKVTLVEYSDFECPACAAFAPALNAFKQKYQNQVLFVYRHFPLPQHPNSMIAAQASEAAAKQGKFWEMHDKLFEDQSNWSGSENPEQLFFEYARNLGLNMDQFRTDYGSIETKNRIERDIESGNKSGVEATPSFYLNGKKVINLQTYGDLDRLIEQALSEK